MSQPVNTGLKIYTLLVEYSSTTGLPTGRIKINIPSDPNYIAPVTDTVSCPTGAGPVPMENIIVDLIDFTVTVKLMFSTAHIDRTTSGTWSVVDRPYDGVVFDITNATSNNYKLRIEYNSTFKEVNATGTGIIFVPGPFIHITKIQIIATDGDYNVDYGNDYKI